MKVITKIDKNGNDIDGQIYEDFDALYVSICKELEEYGYDVIETSQSEESLKKTFEANEYTFLENGEMFNN